MKTTLLRFTGFILLLFISSVAFAQGHTKNVGDSYTYTVTADTGPGTNTYEWTIGGTENDQWEVTSGSLTSTSVTILWLKPGTYNVEFKQDQEHGGVTCSTIKSGDVIVSNNFDATIANGTSVCGGTTGSTNFTFSVSKSGGNPNWSFHYTTDGLGVGDEVADDISVVGVDSYSLVIPVLNVTDGTDKTFNVVLTLIKDSAGNVDTDNSNDETATVTLYGVPNTGGINW
ncbi:hypothetical protein [Labilibaculum antarcticum]|uniref:PKD domain-containing protein n=1 Tax=Labilibaculum antarcticum TaxID=1717717 RepID=A0A1Y1CK77_9BACT|nr:hypothetical protein [Labilibaculum antarcticum]BAX80690.1 hypothetical protein ALGA_2363 [Labilibaculum antarcticum]